MPDNARGWGSVLIWIIIIFLAVLIFCPAFFLGAW
ncbi:hypothetical protein DFR58_104211 [Anaerobacterium chartisolvens]|uniref:Uncharacterized protein n=1 Tax=Anaerobacterium chartisolvens TaxID=1297424 RepID=A0A369BEC3_9FIRM|nr:hypothetical protein DFR58_104211 [Anaerobacterium chartisolvens]